MAAMLITSRIALSQQILGVNHERDVITQSVVGRIAHRMTNLIGIQIHSCASRRWEYMQEHAWAVKCANMYLVQFPRPPSFPKRLRKPIREPGGVRSTRGDVAAARDINPYSLGIHDSVLALVDVAFRLRTINS